MQLQSAIDTQTNATRRLDGEAPSLERSDLDPGFAARAAVYLRNQGLDLHTVALALRTELGVPAPDALRLAAVEPTIVH